MEGCLLIQKIILQYLIWTVGKAISTKPINPSTSDGRDFLAVLNSRILRQQLFLVQTGYFINWFKVNPIQIPVAHIYIYISALLSEVVHLVG